ncbi:MAG: hypothetical protein JNK45_16275 [Myxococcales bacterium]|nr:hypothetical protein [Myxococcales bacterium]
MIHPLASVDPRSPCIITALKPAVLVAAGLVVKPACVAVPGLKKTCTWMKLALRPSRGMKIETGVSMRPASVRSGIVVSNVCAANLSVLLAVSISSARRGVHAVAVATSARVSERARPRSTAAIDVRLPMRSA